MTDHTLADRILADGAFRDQLTVIIPQMRAFARTLCRNAAEADDLAQECLAKAWANRGSYQPGTNLKAWTFTILRNQFYSGKRRSWRQQPLDQEVAERTLIAVSNLDATLELDDVRRALAMLPDEQREALILIGVAGLPYEEASQICGCAEGTIKSRVSRARVRLAQILAGEAIDEDDVLPSAAMNSLVADANRFCRRAA